MPEHDTRLIKAILLIFGIAILLYFLAAVRQVLLLFALIIVLTMMLVPPVSWLERHHVPRGVGAALTILVLLAILAGLILWLLPSIIEQTGAFIADIPGYWERIQRWATAQSAQYPRVQQMLSTNQRLISTLVGHAEAVLRQASQLVMIVVTGIATAALVLIMTMFLLIQPRPLLKGMLAMVPASSQEPVARAIHTIAQQMRVYLYSSLLIGTVNGVIVYIALSLLGVQPALVLAVLALLGEFFPYIGPIAAAIPALLLAFTVSPWTALWVLLLYLAIQQLEASVLSPLILSKQLKFHPLSVAFTILALGTLFGILGAFLAIPALATVKAFYNELVLAPKGVDQDALDHYADFIVEAKKRE